MILQTIEILQELVPHLLVDITHMNQAMHSLSTEDMTKSYKLNEQTKFKKSQATYSNENLQTTMRRKTRK